MAILKYWHVGLIVLITIFLTAALFRSCYHPKLADNTAVRKIQEQLKEKETESKRQQQLFIQREDSLHVLTDSLRTELHKKDISLTHSQIKIEALLARGEIVKSDTPAYVSNCDTLRTQVGSLVQQVNHYKTLADSAFVKMDDRLIAKDSIILSQQQLYSRIRGALNDVAANYTKLSADYDKAQKRIRRARTFSRITAAVALVLGGLLIIK